MPCHGFPRAGPASSASSPPLGTMRRPPRATDISAPPPPNGYRCSATGLSSALTGHRGRHTLCSVQLMEASSGNVQVEANMSHSPTALMSTGRDDSAVTSKGFCTISWNLKADVLDGYIIFVTGDPVTLGCWEPDMAVQLDPSIKSENEWTAEIQILVSRGNKIGVSKKITGIERTRLKGITKLLRPPGFTLTARTVAAGHSWEELQKDLDRLLSTWKGITEHAQSAALAAQEGVEGAVPVILYRSKGQALSIVQDDFNEKVKRLVVDSPRTYHEVTSYLQEVAPELCNRVDLYEKRTPIFDEYKIEKEIDNILCKRVVLQNGGSLIIEQTEALVSIDVNGGHSMFGQGTSQEKAILDVNLEAAKQIARELRLRDIGGIIVVDFIDMTDDSNKRLVYEEMKKAVEKDRSTVGVSELSKLGLMEITRKRVRPSVTFMISEPCPCCHGIGRVEALDTSFSKIEREICRRLAASGNNSNPEKPKSWPRFLLRVDHEMCTYLTSGKKTKLGLLSSSLKVWVLLKIARGFTRGAFELLPYSDEKDTDEQKESSPDSLPLREAGRPKLSVFPIKKWMSRAKRAM